MIVVDSSVWIDYFNGTDSPAANTLHGVLSSEAIAIGDLILTEVLQGFRSDAHHAAARSLLTALPVLSMLGADAALKAADNFRALRKRGITIRKTADVIIATYCIEHDHALLFSDKDFLPFVKHLGLRTASAHASGRSKA